MITAKITTVTIWTLALAFLSSYSYGYEFSTHAAMTREAYNRSLLQTTDTLTQIVAPMYGGYLGDVYLDMDPDGTVTPRMNNPVEAENRKDTKNFTQTKFDDANRRLNKGDTPVFQSPEGWIMVGSIREDDVKYVDGQMDNTPQDAPDPPGNVNRLFNHFYDPYYDRPLTVGANLSSPTPVWAIEGTGGGVIDLARSHGNHFSIADAKEAMFRAATLRTLDSNGQLVSVSPPNTDDVAWMLAYWATTFRALGDAAHLLQDMAQPQHTRNDTHGGRVCWGTWCISGNTSFFEQYIEARAAGKTSFKLPEYVYQFKANPLPGGRDGSIPIVSNDLLYDYHPVAYPIPEFNGYYDFFRSAGARESSYSGTGLSNYSNMNFYTAGTNVENCNMGSTMNLYPNPPKCSDQLDKDASKVIDTKTVGVNDDNIKDTNGQLVPVTPATQDAVMALYKYPIKDNLNPSTNAMKYITSYSMFDQFLRSKGYSSAYTLNHYVYDDQADMLIPRATSYTTGMINYFFRGDMEISLPDEGVYGIVDHADFAPPNDATDPINGFKGFSKIKLKLTNKTEDIVTPDQLNHPQTMGAGGTLVVSMWFFRNTQYKDDLSGELLNGTSFDDYLEKISDMPEFIVSDPVKLDQDLAMDEDIELTFNFPSDSSGHPHGLPINAWEIHLFLTYRGKLGDEDDAVIVSGEKLAPPIFLTVENDTDYVSLANQMCYTRDQIIADTNLWNMLRSDCKKSLDPLQPREFTENCLAHSMNAEVTFAGSSLHTDWDDPNGAIPVRRFGRIAFLMNNEEVDATAFMWDTVGGSKISRNQNFKNLSDFYFTFSKDRGVNSYGWAGMVTGGDNSPTGSDGCANGYTLGNPTDLLDDAGNVPYPVPVTGIVNWDDPAP